MIMCLGFVFSAMVELALVLILKQKQGWVTAIENTIEYDASSEDTVFKARFKADNNIFTGPAAAKVGCNMIDTKEHETRMMSFWRRMLRIFYALPLTSKIDLSVFLLFYLCFFLMNCIYWPTVLHSINEHDFLPGI